MQCSKLKFLSVRIVLGVRACTMPRLLRSPSHFLLPPLFATPLGPPLLFRAAFFCYIYFFLLALTERDAVHSLQRIPSVFLFGNRHFAFIIFSLLETISLPRCCAPSALLCDVRWMRARAPPRPALSARCDSRITRRRSRLDINPSLPRSRRRPKLLRH